MNKIKKLFSFMAIVALLTTTVSPAFAANTDVSNQTELQNAVNSASSGDTITVINDIPLVSRVDINTSDFTIIGNGYTLRPTFSWTSNSNNASLGIFGDNLVIQNLIVDGSLSTGLHGINVYIAQNLFLDNVTSINNGRAGIVVNGSTVTVNNIATSGNAWGGINVDQGGGVSEPAILTVNGVSTHNEVNADIWLDDITKNVGVVDTNTQYEFEDFGVTRAYKLIVPPGPYDVPEECKDIPNLGEPIIGTNGSDSIKGTNGNDLIFARGGSDSVKGGKGHDCIVGGGGDDSLKGQNGNDVILGGNGSDSIKGGNGNDTLFGENGSDSLKGQSGNDYIDGGTGSWSDAIKGGKNTDTCMNAASIKQCEL